MTEVGEVEIAEQLPHHHMVKREAVGLCVLNPEGQFFNRGVLYHDGAETPGDPECDGLHADGPHRYCACGWAEASFTGGTWHWPERVEG